MGARDEEGSISSRHRDSGGWRDSCRMAEAVERGDVDMIGLGRPLREDPFFVNKVLTGEIWFSKL